MGRLTLHGGLGGAGGAVAGAGGAPALRCRLVLLEGACLCFTLARLTTRSVHYYIGSFTIPRSNPVNGEKTIPSKTLRFPSN